MLVLVLVLVDHGPKRMPKCDRNRPTHRSMAACFPPGANRPGEVVLEEKPLRVTLGIELVKLLPAEAPKGPPGPPRSASR